MWRRPCSSAAQTPPAQPCLQLRRVRRPLHRLPCRRQGRTGGVAVTESTCQSEARVQAWAQGTDRRCGQEHARTSRMTATVAGRAAPAKRRTSRDGREAVFVPLVATGTYRPKMCASVLCVCSTRCLSGSGKPRPPGRHSPAGCLYTADSDTSVHQAAESVQRASAGSLSPKPMSAKVMAPSISLSVWDAAHSPTSGSGFRNVWRQRWTSS